MSPPYPVFEAPGARTSASPPSLSQSGQQAPYSPPPSHQAYRPFQAPSMQQQQQQPSFQAYPPPPPVFQQDPKRQSYVQSTPSQLDFSMAGLSLANYGYVQATQAQPHHQPHPQQQQRQQSTATIEKSLPALPPMGLDVEQSPGNSSGHGVMVEYVATTSTLSDELGSYLSDQDSFAAPPPPPSTSAVPVPVPASNSPQAQEVAHRHSPPNVVTTITTVYSIPSPISAPSPPSSQQSSAASRPVSPPPSSTASSWPAFTVPAPVSTNITTNNSQGHPGVPNSVVPVQGQQQQQQAAYNTESSAPDQASPSPPSSRSDPHQQQQQQQQSFFVQQAPYGQSNNNYGPQPTYAPQPAYVPQSAYASQPSYGSQSKPPSQAPYIPQQQLQQQQQQQQQKPHPYQPLPAQGPYSIPPLVFDSDQESPSTLVPSLGLPSPVHSTHPGSLVNMYRAPSPSPSIYPPPPPSSMSASSMAGDRMSISSRTESTLSAQRMSISSEDGRGGPGGGQGERQYYHLRAGSHESSGLIPGRVSPLPSRISPLPLQVNCNNNDRLKPIPANSEDWAALIDTPASPVYERGMRQPFPGPPPFVNGPGYTDSPAAEEPGQSSDYMQHVSQHQRGRSLGCGGYPGHAMADSTSTSHHRLSYQHHQHHSSASSVPLPSGPADLQGGGRGSYSSMSVPGNRQLHRQSWSPNTFEPLDAPLSGSNSRGGANLNGYLTPPRRNDSSPHRRSHSKQSSVATSVSLLTDQAILGKYRDAANKSNDTNLQLSFAKYLLEIGEPSSPTSPLSPPASLEPPPPVSTGSMGGGPPSSAGGTSPLSSSPTPYQQQDDAEMSGKRKLTQEAIYWIDRLAKEGQPEAQFIRGIWYEDGLYGTKKNADKALRWFQSASKGDYPAAHYKVAFYCEKRKDNNKAVVLYKKAATHNDVPANHRLAMVYLYGELGQSRNMKTGLQYLKRAASFATEAAPMAPYVLGQILAREYKQLNIPDDIAFPDDGEALEWFKKGAELAVQAGDPTGEAEMALSGWYLSGAENCFEADDILAFQYASKAAEKKLPKAQYAMGYYYEVGISVASDLGKAMEFYKLAAANGNKEAQARLKEQSGFDRSGHKNSIRRISNGRNAKDSNCRIM
ncbi:hypothetical protein BGW39_005528 [Mortierella sp. 14UC]|nr:hypothetical protein BGW39_005528 [Mortierella sp. 14UC]